MKKSRIIRLIITAALTLLVAFSCAPLWAQADEVSAEVASLKGTVTVKRAASEKSFAAFTGLKLKQGDVVTTAAGGEIVVNIGADKTVKALSDSSFKISNLSGTDAASEAGFTLIKGTVFNEVRSPQITTEGMTVRTGNAVVGVRGTTYTVSLRGKDGFTVRTLEGSVFLDNVVKRLTEEQNAALVHQETTVGAGQGAGQNGTYELTMADFTATELEYITQHPDDFPADMVAEAQTLLDKWEEPTALADAQNQIVYETATPSGGGGGGGGGGGNGIDVSISPATATVAQGGTQQFTATVTGTGSPAQTVTWAVEGGTTGTSISAGGLLTVGANETATTLTVRATSTADTSKSGTAVVTVGAAAVTYTVYLYNDYSNGYVNYYNLSSVSVVAEGQTIPASTFTAASAGKVGYTLIGWYDKPQDIAGGTRYDNGTTPVTSDLTLYPYFTQVSGQDGQAPATAFEIDATNFPHFCYFAHTQTSPTGYSVAGLAANYKLTGNINFASYSSLEWEPIGDILYPFTGSFDGGSNTISGFSLTTTDKNYTGFFGLIDSNATVKDLTITGSSINANDTSVSGDIFVGAIVGRANGAAITTNITGCHASINVTGSKTTTSSGGIYAGGIIGFADNISPIENCSSTGNVTARATAASVSMVCAGGIAGDNNITQITNCAASGTITAESTDDDANAGGIAGNSTGPIEKCYAKNATVRATSTTTATAGGIVGYINAGLSNCYATGARVSATGTGVNIAGGIVGNINTALLDHCYVADINVTALANAGGIAGNSNSVISNCAAYSGSISGGSIAGRICGTSGYSFGASNWGETNFGSSSSWGNGATGLDGANELQTTMDETWWTTAGNWSASWDFVFTWQWDTGLNLPTLITAPTI